jgi:flagellar motor switch protein FliN/FliY
MNIDLKNILESEIVSTIEALIGIQPSIKFKTYKELNIISFLLPEIVFYPIELTNNKKLALTVNKQMTSALSNMMMGEGIELDSNLVLNKDDLDAVKEIFANIAGATMNTMNASDKFTYLETTKDKKEIMFVSEESELSLEDYSGMYSFEIELQEGNKKVKTELNFLFNHELENNLSNKEEKKEQATQVSENKNRLIDKIKDIEMEVSLRIGNTKMLLRDIVNIDIGTVIELDKLANDPVELYVENTLIAYGETVIVDGNFGIQITKIISDLPTKKELKG